MSFISRMLGQKDPSKPFDVTILYQNGTVGTMPIWGRDMRDVLKTVDYWLPQQVPVLSLSIVERERDAS